MSSESEKEHGLKWWIRYVIVPILVAIIGGGGIIGIIVALSPTVETTLNTDPVAGNWTGIIKGENEDFSTRINLSIQKDCKIGSICGTVSAPELPCSGNIVLIEINGRTFIFEEQNMAGADFCSSGGREYLQLLPDGSLSWVFRYTSPSGQLTASNGSLRRQ